MLLGMFYKCSGLDQVEKWRSSGLGAEGIAVIGCSLVLAKSLKKEVVVKDLAKGQVASAKDLTEDREIL